MDTYEKKYKDALERAREWYNDLHITIGLKGNLKNIFPELKECDDKQSKEWILEYLYDGLRKSDEQFKEQFKTAITCLKKHWIESKDAIELEKQGEQKPAKWSKEKFDNFFNLESVIDIVEMYGKGEAPLYGDDVTSELEWLKSFRDRVYWKPTEEQMSCFKQAIDLFKMKVNDDLVLRNLNSLYSNLKKL